MSGLKNLLNTKRSLDKNKEAKMNKYISRILAFALFFIPLCGSLVLGPWIGIADTTAAKEFFVIMVILSITILAVSDRECQQISVKGVTNRPLYALLFFLPFSYYCSPPIQLQYYHENLGGIWIWESMAWVFFYWILYEILRRVNFNKKLVIKAILWSASITSVYACVQIMNIDQFQFVRHNSWIGSPAAKHITGMIGCPTYLAIWLVMCFPFILAYGKWPLWILAGFVIVSTKSDIGIGGLTLMAVLWPAFRAKKKIWLYLIAGVAILTIVLLALTWREIKPKITDNGRFGIWAAVIEDIQAPCILVPIMPNMTNRQKLEFENMNKRTYALTGRGLGSFPYIFGAKYTTPFESAHNEYLEIPYSIGLFGLIIFMSAMLYLLWISFEAARGDLFLSACYCSFVFSAIAAFGVPIWHVEPLRFYSATMFIFLSSYKK